jgi:outer membrane protein TolC
MIVLAFVLAGAAPARSGERVISLREALDYSLADNHAIRAFSESLSAEKEEIGIARSFLLPKLRFEERFLRTNNPTFAFMAKLNQERFKEADFAVDSLNAPEPVNDFQTEISFEQPLFAPKAYIGIKMAKNSFDARGDEFERKKAEIALQVFKAYLGIQTAKAYVDVSVSGVGDAKEHLRVAEARYNSETGLYSDKLRAEVALSSAEERLVKARKNLAVAKRRLGLLLGLSESVDVTEDRLSFEVKSLEYYYGAATSRKDLKSMETKHRNAGNMLKMANAGYLPVLGLGGAYQLNDHESPLGSEGDSWRLTAFLRWEIFDGLKREHERRQAKHRIAEAGEYLEGLKKEIHLEVYDAYLGVEEAEKSLSLARTALSAAGEGERLVRVRYENSLSTIVDLLDVQTNLDSARAGVVEKEAAYLSSVAELFYQSGTILREFGMQNENSE